MAEVFRRPRLASELAGRLLHPGVLDESLRSGLFLAGMRRTGKTTFLRTDLVPELEAQGAVVIDVDLWSDTRANPAALVQAAVLARLRREGMERLPSEAAAWEAFQALGHRPEEFLRAPGQLRSSRSAELELHKLEQIGALATAIFERQKPRSLPRCRCSRAVPW